MGNHTDITLEAARSLVDDLSHIEARIDAERAKLVSEMRTKGYTWKQIGELFDVTRQAAQQRWGEKIKDDRGNYQPRWG